MIDWLRSKFTETRGAAEYTNILLAQRLAAVQGAGSVRESAVYRSCLNLIESASSSAELEGQHSGTLQAKLGGIVKEMVHTGQSAYELVIGSGGRLELQAVEITDVYGGVSEESWLYRITRPGPSSTEMVIRPQGGVLNFRLHPDPRSPWRGTASLPPTNTTATLLSKMEAQLTSEAAFKPARLLTAGIAKEQRKDVTDSLVLGGVVTLPQSRMGSDSKALHTGSVGGEYSLAGVDFFGQLSALICTTLGVPADLIQATGSDTSSKESFRRFALSTITPLLQIVMTEWTRLVGEMTFDLDRLRAADAVSIARATGSKATAVGKLVSAGVGLDEALSIVGID